MKYLIIFFILISLATFALVWFDKTNSPVTEKVVVEEVVIKENPTIKYSLNKKENKDSSIYTSKNDSLIIVENDSIFAKNLEEKTGFDTLFMEDSIVFETGDKLYTKASFLPKPKIEYKFYPYIKPLKKIRELIVGCGVDGTGVVFVEGGYRWDHYAILVGYPLSIRGQIYITF